MVRTTGVLVEAPSRPVGVGGEGAFLSPTGRIFPVITAVSVPNPNPNPKSLTDQLPFIKRKKVGFIVCVAHALW